MGINGGARPGAGRKPKDEKFKVPIAKAEKRIADKLPMLIDKALELAEGVLVEDVNIITMQRSVYQKPPDLGAIKYLVDRIMGKPTERQEVTGANGSALEVTTPAIEKATQEITAWRKQMSEQLNGLNALPTQPTPATPTESLTTRKD